MKNQWYLLLYHGIGWEEPLATKYISGMHSPDIFRDHVKEIKKIGHLLSFREGLNCLKQGKITKPIFTFWFDDGLTSVRKYAFPILKKYNSLGVISVCSSFFLQDDLFWRSKLSVLHHLNGMPELRKKLRQYGFNLGYSIKDFTMDFFSEEIIYEINSIFN